MYRESASNVRIGLKCTENRPQMYCASNVQRIGLKCTENRPQMYRESASNVQINKFLTVWSIYAIWCVYLSISLAKIYLCTFEADLWSFEADSLFIWGRFSYVHLRPIGLYRTSPGRGRPILWAQSRWFHGWSHSLARERCGRVRSASNVLHLRPILLYIWGQFSVHLRPIL